MNLNSPPQSATLALAEAAGTARGWLLVASQLPGEMGAWENCEKARELERFLVKCACGLVPLGSLSAAFAFGDQIAYLVNLNPAVLAGASPPMLIKVKCLLGLGVGLLPFVWLLLFLLEKDWLTGKYPALLRWIPVLFCGLALSLSNLMFSSARFCWYFFEAAKVRLEKFSHPRAVAYWRADDINPSLEEKKIVIPGSSQPLYAIDPGKLRSTGLQDYGIAVRFTPGFAILQYLLALPDLPLKAKSCTVVCWISEFDAFREERLPVNRLRLFSNLPQLRQLVILMSPSLCWKNREELADLAFSGGFALCHHRDILKQLAFDFWWRAEGDQSPQSLAKPSDRITNIVRVRAELGKAVRRTDLTELNFRAFAAFAQQLVARNVRLLVVEGQTNPQAVDLYPKSYRTETRQRIRELARQVGFEYRDESQVPRFGPDDFIDAAHLNANARDQFTDWLGKTLLDMNRKIIK